jgi:hypothetical protein
VANVVLLLIFYSLFAFPPIEAFQKKTLCARAHYPAARLCATLEAAQGQQGEQGQRGVNRGGLIEGYTLSQPTLQQVLLNLQHAAGTR